MRIGILTFHAAYNYGAVLQCYALQEYLQSLGNDVSVIDYRNRHILEGYTSFCWGRILRKNPIILMRLFYRELSLYPYRKARARVFDNFVKTKLNLVPVNTINTYPYDLILVGSDQVWNYHLTGGFDDYYWGNFEKPESTKLCSYAASMHDYWSKDEALLMSELLCNFDEISVREQTTAEQISELVRHKKIWQISDPTLLFDEKKWSSIATKPIIKEPYLLIYEVDESDLSSVIANKISNEKKLKIIKLTADISESSDRMVRASSPSDFVGLFKYASYIVCSSFHGTIFSLQFKKNFYSIQGKGKNARVHTLLTSLNLLERFVNKCPEVITDINYSNIELSNLSNSAKDFINYIGNEK